MKKYLLLAGLLALSITCWAQIKVACVGNSITYGSGIEGRDSLAYPQQLNKILGEGWQVENFGVSGATLLKKGDKPYWDQPDFQQAKDFQADIVIIKLGTNDSKPQNWDKYGDEFSNDLGDMIREFLSLESHPVVWLGLPVKVVTEEKWGIRKSIVEGVITPEIRQAARQYSLGVVNFFRVLEDKPELIPDYVHPDAAGARLMAEEAARVLLEGRQKGHSYNNVQGPSGTAPAEAEMKEAAETDTAQSIQAVPDISGWWLMDTDMRSGNGITGHGQLTLNLIQVGTEFVGQLHQLLHPGGRVVDYYSDVKGRILVYNGKRASLMILERVNRNGDFSAVFTAVIAPDAKSMRGHIVNNGYGTGDITAIRIKDESEIEDLSGGNSNPE